ncbi:MAG: nucleotide sugar dehydrogenase, partial [Candidatus Odinarchaeota archaeon]
VSPTSIVYKMPSVSKISGAMEDLDLTGKETKTLKLSLRNLDDFPHDVNVKLILPRELKVDVDEKRIQALKEGTFVFDDPDINDLLKDSDVQRNLTFHAAIQPADVYIICVPTPIIEHKEIADLSYLEKAVDSMCTVLKKGDLIIIESTTPTKTARENIIPAIKSRTGLVAGEDVYLAQCPERILPGNIYHELVNNDRIIGGITEQSTELAAKLYSRIVKGNLYKTDDITAEFCKLMENAYRDVNIAFANEMALLAENLGIDPQEAIRIANKHPRVNILTPGIGVGGHCLPLDPWFLKEQDPLHTSIISTARRVNDSMPFHVARKIRIELKELCHPKIAVAGLAYKPNVNDSRESPAFKIVSILREEGYTVEAFDPLVDEKSDKKLEDRVKGFDCLVVLVKHDVLMEDLAENQERIKKSLNHPIIMIF